MAGFTKLFADIVHSTVWREDVHTKIVWITMLAMSDRHGQVMSSLPGLADSAKVTLNQCIHALSILSAPDQYSRTKEYEGRRISDIDGGWLLLNYEKYRARKDDEEQRLRTMDRVRRHRARLVTESVTATAGHPIAEADSESDTEAENKSVSNVPIVPVVGESQAIPTSPAMKTKKNDVPHESIVALYHETLPELPKVVKLTKQRHGYIRQRWQEDLPDLQAWTDYFNIVRKSKFLMGKTNGSKGRPPFRADLTWLCRPENIVKVIEGKYHAG